MFLYILRVDGATHDQTSTGTVLQVEHRTEQPQCQHDTAAGARALPAVRLNVLPLGEAWKGENQLSTEPTTGICRSSPCKAQPKMVREPPGMSYLRVPRGCCGASPLPAGVLHLLSEAEAVLPVSLF